MADPVRIVILGSTGSIGTQTLEVIESLSRTDSGFAFEVVGIAAGRCSSSLAAQSHKTNARFVASAEPGGLDVHSER